MICVYAIAKVKPGLAQAFEETGSRLVNASRAEAANISYTLCRALESENVYTFIEQWKDRLGGPSFHSPFYCRRGRIGKPAHLPAGNS